MKYLIPILLALGVASCDNNSTAPTEFTYQLKITNLTNGQPFSPPAAILHDADFAIWKVGSPASEELEQLAEGGAPGPLLESRAEDPGVAGAGAIAPGASEELMLTTTDDQRLNVSIATMLVNSNDAFSGISAIDVSAMESGDTRTYLARAYDAGTENNSELATTIPGPAGGGEGFNVERDDFTTVVTAHGGIVSYSDGYADSALSEAQRFDNPVMKVEITRL